MDHCEYNVKTPLEKILELVDIRNKLFSGGLYFALVEQTAINQLKRSFLFRDRRRQKLVVKLWFFASWTKRVSQSFALNNTYFPHRDELA